MRTAPKIRTPYTPTLNARIKKKTSYETLTEAIADLNRQGYTKDLNVMAEKDCLVCSKSDLRLSPEEFQIDQTYRFEGETDPGDEMIVFAVSSSKYKVKGIVVNAFGPYADTNSSEIVAQLLKKAKPNKAPIKRHPALVQLSRDHHFGLLLVWKIRQGLKRLIEPERISNYVQFFFKEDLQGHFTEEEKELFVKLQDDDSLKIQALSDHRIIYELVNSLKADEKNIYLLNEFADKLEAHIRFEERSLFNHLQEKLTEKELEELACGHSSHNINLDDKWEDNFWTYKR